MEAYQVRVIEEKEQLGEKIAALVEFMHGGIYPSMAAIDQGLLMVQLDHMRMYSDVLCRRIERFQLSS